MTTALLTPTEARTDQSVLEHFETEALRRWVYAIITDKRGPTEPFETEALRRWVYAIITDKRGPTEPFVITDRATVDGHRIYLITTRGWQYYSSRVPARYRTLAWLYGTDDAGEWARRVPATATSVLAAIEAITPAVVRDARRSGRRVLRQGDIYTVETSPRYDGAGVPDLPASHHWNPSTRYLTHRPDDGGKHSPLRVVWPCRFVPQLFGAASFTTD